MTLLELWILLLYILHRRAVIVSPADDSRLPTVRGSQLHYRSFHSPFPHTSSCPWGWRGLRCLGSRSRRRANTPLPALVLLSPLRLV